MNNLSVNIIRNLTALILADSSEQVEASDECAAYLDILEAVRTKAEKIIAICQKED